MFTSKANVERAALVWLAQVMDVYVQGLILVTQQMLHTLYLFFNKYAVFVSPKLFHLSVRHTSIATADAE